MTNAVLIVKIKLAAEQYEIKIVRKKLELNLIASKNKTEKHSFIPHAMVGHSMVTIKRWLLRAHVMQKVLYQERYEISELTRDKMRIFLKLYLEFQDEAKRLGKVKQQVPVGTTMRPLWWWWQRWYEGVVVGAVNIDARGC